MSQLKSNKTPIAKITKIFVTLLIRQLLISIRHDFTLKRIIISHLKNNETPIDKNTEIFVTLLIRGDIFSN